jgi:glycine dehydrogenase subunit 2
MDIAKRLLDYGFHPPTVYFPLIVHEALMIEPTETEGLDTLNKFRDALIKINEECKNHSNLVKNAPHTTPVRRLNEAKAARELDVNFYK